MKFKQTFFFNFVFFGFMIAGKITYAQGQRGLGGYLSATIGNKNVYKTKITLPVTKAYENKTVVLPLKNITDTFLIRPELKQYIRYKVVLDDGDFKYIKILPGCTLNEDRTIVYNDTNEKSSDPSDIVFKVSKKLLEPNSHYLASSALIGKVITLPVRIRKESWNNNNTVLQGALSLGMGFGWKLKLGNNPYQTNFINFIVYGAGISQQKHFTVNKNVLGKDSVGVKTDEIAVTYFTQGITYEHERFNLGLFWGKDRMFGSLKSWAYQDKWWWGIGIGYELFK